MQGIADETRVVGGDQPRKSTFQPSSGFCKCQRDDLAAKAWSGAGGDGNSAVPFVVNSSFATELYLKAIALLNGKKLHGHELDDLLRRSRLEVTL